MDGLLVTLTEDDAQLATQLVAKGRYSSPEEVVRAAMDILRDAVANDADIDWDFLRAAAAEGEAAIARGDYVDLGSDESLNAHLDGIMARVQAEAERGRVEQ